MTAKKTKVRTPPQRGTTRERKTTPKKIAGTVSGTELAGILADPPFTDRWLRELADRGYLVKAGRGAYDLKRSVQGYLRFVRETEVKAAAEQAATNTREQFEQERARKLKLENDKKEALLVETPEALAAIDAIFGQVSAALDGIPARISENVNERRRIENVIDAVRADLAERLDKAGAALQEGGDPLEATDTLDA